MTSTAGSPSRLETLLVATDFSDASVAGLRWAISLAKLHGASVHLVHALGLTTGALEVAGAGPDVEKSLETAGRRELERLVGRLREEGVSATWEVDAGPVSTAVMRIAGELPADLVVIGTRGLEGVRKLLLGSNAERILRFARQPVLVVPATEPHPGAPVRRVLQAVDFSAGSHRAVDALVRLLGPRASDVEVLAIHAFHLHESFALMGAYGTARHPFELRAEVKERLIRRLEVAVEPLRAAGFRVELQTLAGDPAAVLLEAAEDFEADLICLGTHGRTGLSYMLLGSTARRVVSHAVCPVLTAHEAEETATQETGHAGS